jgi:hypothetical protein
MTEDHHPLRDEPLIVYENAEHGCVAFFGKSKRYPVYVQGETFDEVVGKAEEFRKTLLEKHEKAYLARKKAALISQQKRKKRKQKND